MICASTACNKPIKNSVHSNTRYCSDRCRFHAKWERTKAHSLAAHQAPVPAKDPVYVTEQTDMNGDLLYAVKGRGLGMVTHSRRTVDLDVRATFREGETWDSVVKFIPDGHEPRTSLTARIAWVKHYERSSRHE